MLIEPLLRDRALADAVEEQGFTVLDVLESGAVDLLVDLQASTLGDISSGFRHSMLLQAGDAKRAAREGILAACRPIMDAIFEPHAVTVCGFLVKGTGEEGTIPPHLDWNFVDESRHRSLNLWLALCDTDANNGALAVIPGSHRLPPAHRGSGVSPLVQLPPEVVGPHLKVIPLRAGQAILYDARVIHASAPNTSGRNRIAAGICIIPGAAQPVHYVQTTQEEPVYEVEVDVDFFEACAIDASLDRDPNIEELIANRPSRIVSELPAISENDLWRLRPRWHSVRRLLSPRRRRAARMLLSPRAWRYRLGALRARAASTRRPA